MITYLLIVACGPGFTSRDLSNENNLLATPDAIKSYDSSQALAGGNQGKLYSHLELDGFGNLRGWTLLNLSSGEKRTPGLIITLDNATARDGSRLPASMSPEALETGVGIYSPSEGRYQINVGEGAVSIFSNCSLTGEFGQLSGAHCFELKLSDFFSRGHIPSLFVFDSKSDTYVNVPINYAF